MDKNLHLAFFTPSLSTGGTGKMRVHLTQQLVRRGVKIDLLLGEAQSPYTVALDPNVRVIEIGTTNAIWSLPRLIYYLRRERPAAMITDRLRLNVAALRSRRLACVPTRICTSVHIPLSHKLETLSAAKRKSELAAIHRFYPLNDSIVAVSRGVAQDLIHNLLVPAERVRVVYNPVITDEILALTHERLDHPWFDSSDIPVILGAGRFRKQKDFPTLIRAFAELRREKACRLMILGQGKEQPRLESLAAELGILEDFALPGFVTNPYKYMARANLFVLSSAWEGFGNVLAEALAVGVPVVSTDCRYGPREVLQDGRYGPLVPVGDVGALAAAMQATLDNPLPANLLQSAATPYTAEASAEGYLNALGFISQ